MSESSLRRKSSSPNPSRGGRGGESDDVLRQVREQAALMAGRVVDGTREVKEQVMQKASELTRAVADGVREEAEKFFDEQKGKLGTKVDRVGKMINQAAHALHAVKADPVAEAVDAAGERVKQASAYIEESTLGQLVADAEDAARRHPGVVLGGLFVTGLLAARFVKASASRENAGAGATRAGESRTAGKHSRNGRGPGSR
jgi:ElaB/YqjD/DUF883 family membrane-anchored ribosome-binding protein